METQNETPISQVPRTQFHGSQTNIRQLAKIARRIPRIISGAQNALAKKRLSPFGRQYYHERLAGARLATAKLATELNRRNIFGAPFSDARNPQHKRGEALRACVGLR